MNKLKVISALSLLVILVAGTLAGCGGNGGNNNGGNATNGGGPKLLFFTMEGCGGCVIAEPIVKELGEQYSNEVDFEIIDTDDYETFLSYQRKYNFQAVPTVVVTDSSGNVVLAETGIGDEAAYKKKLTEALEEVSK